MKTITQITLNTIRENLREPIFFLILLIVMALLAILPSFGAIFSFGDSTKVISDSGLGSLIIAGWISIIFAASHAIAKEISQGTVLVILSKPVNRMTFFTGKILGILALALIFSFLLSLAILLTIQIATDDALHPNNTILAIYLISIILGCGYGAVCNYFNNKSFCMSAIFGLCLFLPLGFALSFLVPQGDFPKLYTPILPALVLATEAIMIMGVFAVALSTRLKTGACLFACFLLFISGLFADYLSYLYSDSNWVQIILNLLPNWQTFWLADAVSSGEKIPLNYLWVASCNTLLFCFAFTILGYILFQYREVGVGVSRD